MSTRLYVVSYLMVGTGIGIGLVILLFDEIVKLASFMGTSIGTSMGLFVEFMLGFGPWGLFGLVIILVGCWVWLKYCLRKLRWLFGAPKRALADKEGEVIK